MGARRRSPGGVFRTAGRRQLRQGQATDTGTAADAQRCPTVFVSTSPAAIIATSGPPQFVAIPGPACNTSQIRTPHSSRMWRRTLLLPSVGPLVCRRRTRRSVDLCHECVAAGFRTHTAEQSPCVRAGFGPGYGGRTAGTDRVADPAGRHARSRQRENHVVSPVNPSSSRSPAPPCCTRPILPMP